MQSPLSLIPADKLSAVEKALLHTFNTTDVSQMEPLAGGLSDSMVYKIALNGQWYVLKLYPPAGAPGNTDGRFACMKIAADAGIAPPLYYLNTEDGLSVSAFIESKSLRAVFSSPDTLLTELAKTIRSIHAMPAFPNESSLLNTVEALIGQIRESPLLNEDLFGNFFEYYDIIREHYPWQDTDKVSSHNDLNPNNLICGGNRIWVLDWDAAFRNDRYVDLAIAANFFVTNEAQESLFLEAYFGDGPDVYKSARFFIMRQTCYLIYAILMFKLASGPDVTGIMNDPEMQKITLREIGAQMGAGKLSLATGKGRLLYGKAMINEALVHMRQPRFMSSIKLLAGF